MYAGTAASPLRCNIRNLESCVNAMVLWFQVFKPRNKTCKHPNPSIPAKSPPHALNINKLAILRGHPGPPPSNYFMCLMWTLTCVAAWAEWTTTGNTQSVAYALWVTPRGRSWILPSMMRRKELRSTASCWPGPAHCHINHHPPPPSHGFTQESNLSTGTRTEINKMK